MGEEEGEAYFKILKEDEVLVKKRGKSIKKLRREAYREYILKGEYEVKLREEIKGYL